VSGGLVRAAAIRFAGFALVWMVLTGGSLYGWPVALATLFAATAASLALVPPGRWSVSPIGVARFVPFFLGYSARAGVDVALRAFRSTMPIRPGFATFHTRLPPGPARTFFAAVVSLFPGTVSVNLEGGTLHLHLLDTRDPIEPALRGLERRVAAVFPAHTVPGAGSDPAPDESRGDENKRIGNVEASDQSGDRP
jgi:multicomponent Na+:H+ antiporter subunit E